MIIDSAVELNRYEVIDYVTRHLQDLYTDREKALLRKLTDLNVKFVRTTHVNSRYRWEDTDTLMHCSPSAIEECRKFLNRIDMLTSAADSVCGGIVHSIEHEMDLQSVHREECLAYLRDVPHMPLPTLTMVLRKLWNAHYFEYIGIKADAEGYEAISDFLEECDTFTLDKLGLNIPEN